MLRTLYALALAALLLPPLLAEDERPVLPKAGELDRFIDECQKLLDARTTQRQPPTPQPAQKPAASDPGDRAKAFAIARELLALKKLPPQQTAFYLQRLKALRTPGVLALLSPLLTYESVADSRRLTLELGKELLPQVFRDELARQRGGGRGKEHAADPTRVACHSPQHLALRGWMDESKEEELRKVAEQRINKALDLLRELQRARGEDDLERVMVGLAHTGEEWIVYPLTHRVNLDNDLTRKAAAELLRHFTGARLDANPGRKAKRWRENQLVRRFEKQAAAIAQRFVFREGCPHCKRVVRKLYLQTGD